MALTETLLEDRGVVFASGADARDFLQNLLTNDVASLAAGEARHAALLTPQGKILCDMLVVATEDGFVLDLPKALAPALVERLELYRLRSKVTVADHSASHVVAALWGGEPPPFDAIAAADPRLPELGWRAVVSAEAAQNLPLDTGAATALPADYHAHRIRLGVPEGGKDYAFGDTFPHEADMDLLRGVDFRKGCYVGQEVVSRMQHKTAVRKRVVPVLLPEHAPQDGAEVRAGERTAGFVGSTANGRGLALLRLDRVEEARAAGIDLTAGGVRVVPIDPPWADLGLGTGA